MIDNFLLWWVAHGQALVISLSAILGGVHMLLVVLENIWPGLSKEDHAIASLVGWLDKWTHGSGAWDQPAPPAVSVASAIKKA